ncbi:MAG: XdhC family protein, partial [Acidimicrobiales bacterium]
MADSIFATLDAALTDSRPVVLATAISGSQVGAKVLLVGGEGPVGVTDRLTRGWTDPGLEATVERDAEATLTSGGNAVRRYGDGGRLGDDAHQVFFEAHVPPPRLVIFGAVDFTA